MAGRKSLQLKAPGGARPRLLLAEDSDPVRIVTAAMLKGMGCDVKAVIHGEQAVRLAASNRYDLILMDMQMPVMSGIEATIAIRAGSGPNRETCILAMTANASPDDHKACLDAGMDGFESKPVRKQKLHAMLAALGDGKQTLVGDKGQMPGMLPVLQDRDRAA